MKSARTPPRFVPTLTEVVGTAPPTTDMQPAPAPSTTAQVPSNPAPAAAPPVESRARRADMTVLTERVLERVLPQIQEEMRDSIHVIIQEQMCLLEADLRKEIDAAVRAAVEKITTETH